MHYDQSIDIFIAESRDLLQDMEAALLAAVGGQGLNAEQINAIFRAAHTIKGSAGLFGFDHIVAFTHVLENVLERLRAGKLTIDAAIVGELLASRDHLLRQVDTIEQRGAAPDPELERAGAPLQATLERMLAETKVPAAARPACWHISIRFSGDVLLAGMDPLSFVRYLGTLGTIEQIAPMGNVPPLDEMDPEHCYLGFEIAFRSDACKADIEQVFEFVRDDCQLRILPPDSQLDAYLALMDELPEGRPRLGEILVACGCITRAELASALSHQATALPAEQLGAILVEQGSVRPEMVEAAVVRQQSAEQKMVRVDANKLDRLIDLIGELTIASAGATLVARRAQHGAMLESTAQITQLVEEVRDSALQLRMVKIGTTFSRFQRVVHDTAAELGKDIRLELSGEETELDKTVVEKVTDPLLHLVRNAIDHGIESPAQRSAKGKPEHGTLRLEACHDSGSIVIQVSDDGAGLDRERILAKGIERGLVEPGRAMSDSEVFDLIFEPGFSTAQAVTNLSGRGVGMDVVKRNIAALRGSVQLSSQAGAGTTVQVRLPLTLAIIDGFMVTLGKSTFVIPLDMIEECVEYAIEPGQDYLNLRGKALPLMRMRDVFRIGGPVGRRQSVVVVSYAGGKAGLVVDQLLGEFQTVIKPLGQLFCHVRCVSGSSILPNGEVALIIDVAALFQALPASPAALAA
jgi:two-component system chemotaxis sensor kinase CheA